MTQCRILKPRPGRKEEWESKLATCEQVNKLTSPVWMWHLLPSAPQDSQDDYPLRRMGGVEEPGWTGIRPTRDRSQPLTSYLIDGKGTWEGRGRDMVLGRRGEEIQGITGDEASPLALPLMCRTKSPKAHWPGSDSTGHGGENILSGQSPPTGFCSKCPSFPFL